MDFSKLKKLIDFTFTFQSGYIQIVLAFTKPPCASFFTFQSGYIQICSGLHDINKYIFLYIPIWLYSNVSKYFSDPERIPTLHSNLVIFKSFYHKNKQLLLFSLHSNLVIFKFIRPLP